MNIDLYFFNLINGFAGRQKWLDYAGVFLAKYLGYLMMMVLVVGAFIYREVNIFVLPVLVGLFSRFIINEFIYIFYKRKRPVEVLNANQVIKKPNHPSFPSGHASFFFGISFALLPFSHSLAVIFIILSFFVSFARIFGGVHWPSDILAGIVAGGVSALMFNQML